MGLNETLDRLKRAEIKTDSGYPDHPYLVRNDGGFMGHFAESDLELFKPDEDAKRLHPLVQDWAKDIFFQRMLKDINSGMSEPKIEAMIDRSIMIATKLYSKLYKNNNE